MISIPEDLGERIIGAARLAAALHEQELARREAGVKRDAEKELKADGVGPLGRDALQLLVTDDEYPGDFEYALRDLELAMTTL
jgi:hypothetical protein